MKKTWIGLALLFSVLQFTQVSAQVELRDQYPSKYTVKLGDTLWDISALYLKSPWLWPEIWQVNPQVANPHLIYPGDVLTMIYIDGKPRLVVNRGEIKLSPNMRTSPLGSAIPAIPLEAINSFLSRSRVVDKETLEDAAYVVAGSEARLLSSAGDRVYGRGELVENTRFYGLYRKGEQFRDPDTREKLGIQALEIGTTRVISESEDVFTAALNQTNEEVRIGDRFLPLADEALTATFFPKAPDTDIDGVIIAVEGGVAAIGGLDVVVINRGAREGVLTGDVLSVLKAGKKVKDTVKSGSVKLPSEPAGLMIVFKVFEKVSYGLILEADRPLSLFDEVTNP